MVRWATARTGLFVIVFFVLAGLSSAQNSSVIAKRPLYQLKEISLNPAKGTASGILHLMWVNPTDTSLHRVAFAIDNPRHSESLVSRIRVNLRKAEVTYKFADRGDPYTGFEVKSSRSMPPGVVSQIEINFETHSAQELYGLTCYLGDWFPRILGPADGELKPDERPAVDYDVTLEYPIDWRGAMTGLILREDGHSNTVEMETAASGATNYGVAIGRDLRVEETDVLGVRLRVFYYPGQERWGRDALADARHVVEYYKRDTPFKPPVVLSVLPGDTTLVGAEPLFTNGVVLHRGGAAGTDEGKLAVAEAVTDLYWGFDFPFEPGGGPSDLETALSQYGVILYSRLHNLDGSWLEHERDWYYAGLLADHNPALAAPIDNGDPKAKRFRKRTADARVFTGMQLLETLTGPEAMETIYNDCFDRYRDIGVTLDRFHAVCDSATNVPIDNFFQSWFKGEGWIHDRIARTENRGRIAGKFVTEVQVERGKSPAMPVTVRVVDVDGTPQDQVLVPDANKLVFRTTQAPAHVLLDPEKTLPLYEHALADPQAVGRLGRELLRQGRFLELRDLIASVRSEDGDPDGALVYLDALARINTGDYSGARDRLTEWVGKGSGNGSDGSSTYAARNQLLLGMVNDLLGNRSEALTAYQAAATYPETSAAAEKYQQAPYTQKDSRGR